MKDIKIKCDKCSKMFTRHWKNETKPNYCIKCSLEIKQMDKEAEELGYKCDECLNEHECIHVSQNLSENPKPNDIVKFILYQRILKVLNRKYFALDGKKAYPILKEKIGLDKPDLDYILYGHIDRFSVCVWIYFAESFEVDFELSIKYKDTDPTYIGSKRRKSKWSHE